MSSISLQYLTPSPSTQPDDRLNEGLSGKPKESRAHQKHLQYFCPYFYPYSLNAFTNNFAAYRHHECHWLRKRLKELSIPENQVWACPPQGQPAQFAVIDRKTVITGSFNWSPSAAHQNDEVLLVIRSPQVAAHFSREMDRLWRSADLGITERLRRKLERNRQRCGSGIERD